MTHMNAKPTTLAEGVKIVHAEATDKAATISAASTDWWKASEKTAEAAKGDWSWHEKQAQQKAAKAASDARYDDIYEKYLGFDAAQARERAIGLGGDEHYDRLRAEAQAAWSWDKAYAAADFDELQASESQFMDELQTRESQFMDDDRRFELAKVAMGAMMSNKGVLASCNRSELVEKAIEYADEMLYQLGE